MDGVCPAGLGVILCFQGVSPGLGGVLPGAGQSLLTKTRIGIKLGPSAGLAVQLYPNLGFAFGEADDDKKTSQNTC